MTSLQKQLAVIASNSHDELDLKAQKTAHSKSLLFEPADAATQSFDTLYQLCLDGFEELCALDSRFVRFSRSIFSPQSRSEDRMQLTAQENNDLDHALDSFLALVSSRLLLRPAQKAVEWLIRRFKVHELNVGATILSFLPHHTTPLFTALLSILPTQLPSQYKFLHSYKNTLQNPPISAIVQAAIQNVSFFTTLNNHVLNVCKLRFQSSQLLSLWATTTAQTVDNRLSSARSGRQAVQNERTEDLLTQLLPILNHGLALKKVPDYVLGCYMIIVTLISKVDLDDSTLDALLSAVVASWSADTFEPGLGCAAAISQRKESATIPVAVVRVALQFDSLASQLVTLSKFQDARALTYGLVLGALQLPNEFRSASLCATISGHQLLSGPDIKAFSGLTAPGEVNGLQDSLSGLQSKMLDMFKQDDEDEQSHAPEVTNALQANDDEINEERDNYVEDMTGSIPHNLDSASFLTEASNGTRTKCVEVFKKGCRSEPRLDSFQQLPIFRNGTKQFWQLMCSFYASVLWTSDAVHAKRIAANRLAQVVKDAPLDSLDFDFITIVTMTALRDDTRQVREAIVRLVVSLAERLQQGESEVGAHWQLYGSADFSLAHCSGKTLRTFVKRYLLNEAEECATDSQHVNKIFERAMRGSSDSSTTGAGQSKKLKSTQRDELVKTLCSHISQNSLTTPRVRLLGMMSVVDKINGQPRSTFLLASFKAWARQHIEKRKPDEPLDGVMAKAFASIAHPKDEQFLQHFVILATQNDSTMSAMIRDPCAEQVANMWPQLKSTLQSHIASNLLAGSRKGNTTISQKQSPAHAAQLLRSLPLSNHTLNSLITFLVPLVEPKAEPTSKKRRTNGSNAGSPNRSSVTPDLAQDLQQVSLCLELIDAADLSADTTLFHNLFGIMQLLQSFQSSANAEVDFPQVVTLNNLLSIARSFSSHSSKIPIDVSIVRVDLLIDCLQNTSNPQVRNSSIGILSILCKYIPEAVMNNIIPVFTVMSKTTARQNDDHSIQIVDSAIQEVIPQLVSALRKQHADVAAATEDIISSFAAAFEHIPHLRRQRLYKLLAMSLGPKDCMHAILAALADRWPANAGVEKFTASLLKQFDLETSLVTVQKYIDLLLSAMHEDISVPTSFLTLPDSHNDRQAKQLDWLRVLYSMTRDGLDSQTMRGTSMPVSDKQKLQTLFAQTLEKLLQLSRSTRSQQSANDQCSLILESLLKLLSFQDFLASIGPLLGSSNDAISKSVLKSLEVQLRFTKRAGTAAKQSALDFLPQLSTIISSRERVLALRLNAVVCVDRICEDYGKIDPEQAFKSAEVILAALQDEDALMRALCMHCLASMVEVLQDRMIPLLQPSLSAVCRCFEQTLSQPAADVRLHNAAFALSISVIEHLSYMVSRSTLIDLLKHAQASASLALTSEADENRQQFYRVLAEKVDVKNVFEAVTQSWINAFAQGNVALRESTALLQSSVDLQPKPAVSKQARALLSTFLTLFDLRRQIAVGDRSSSMRSEQIQPLEREVIAVLLSLILKINDATFRPFFVQLIEWSTDISQGEGQVHRQITIFNLTNTLSERLKSLVTPYFGYILEPAAAVLRSSSSPRSDTPAYQLVVSVLSALTSSFKHDQDDFYQAPSRFALLHPALLAQLPTSSPASPTCLTQTMLIPTVVSFAAAIAQVPDHLNSLCVSLLSLLKGHQPAVLAASTSPTPTSSEDTRKAKTSKWPDKKMARNGKLAAVMTMRALTQELGEEWLGMLPQMLPIVSELLEDGDEKLEGETEAWVKDMEGVLGESLGQMLA